MNRIAFNIVFIHSMFLITCRAPQIETLPQFKLENGLVQWQYACDFPDKYKEFVEESFGYWENIVDKKLFIKQRLCVKDYYPRSHNFIVIRYEDRNKKKGKKTILGTAQTIHHTKKHKNTLIIFYRGWDKYKKGKRISVSRHEVGHALGLGHIDDKRCIMHPDVVKSYHEACDVEINKVLELYGERKD